MLLSKRGGFAKISLVRKKLEEFYRNLSLLANKLFLFARKKPKTVLLSLFVFLLLGVAVWEITKREGPIGRENPRWVEGEVILKLKGDVGLSRAFLESYRFKSAQKVLDQHKFKEEEVKARVESRGLDRLYLAQLPAGANLNKVLARLKKDPQIEYAEPNFIVDTLLSPNDPSFNQLWGLHNTGQTGGTSDADIDAPEAWDTAKTTNLVVGVIDTGVDYNHGDLKDNMWVNPGEVAGNGLDDDGNGFIDDVYGWDFINNDNDPFDDHGHGTHVAGTIAAVGNNGLGVAGVNWSGKIAALKFLSSGGSGSIADAVEALQYANLMGFKITNNSWGGGGFSQALYDAISAASTSGYLFVAAAGNSGVDADTSPMYPAAYGLANIISVAATDHNDQKAGFSNYGVISVDLGAPGASIYSTVPTGSCSLCDPTGYRNLSGTSMASPHVAGAAALFWSYSPSLGHLDLKNKILNTSDTIDALVGKTVSGGRLNLYNFFDTDSTPPAQVSDLSSSAKTHSSVTLKWTAVGDDGTTGQASRYDVRHSTSPIDEAGFALATQAASEPKPSPSGSLESFKVTGLNQDTTYYFALKVYDNVGNASPLSNVFSDTTFRQTVIYSDDLETGSDGWTIEGSDGKGGPSLWHLSQRRANSLANAWYYGIESSGNYDTGAVNWGRITTPLIDLADITGAEVVFWHYLEGENSPPYDAGQVEVTSDGGNSWNGVFSKGTTNGAWVKEIVDLSSYDGSSIKIRFSFDTVDALYNYYEGWYVDDIQVIGLAQDKPPIAQAGADQTASIGQVLTFDGSSSTDVEGPVASYSWDFGDGGTASGAIATHSYNALGSYTVALTVIDSISQIDQDTLLVTVASDAITITKALYLSGKKQLVIEVTSSKGGVAVLTVVGFGNLTYLPSLNLYRLTVDNVAANPGTVTVTSTLGGSASKTVEKPEVEIQD